MAEVGVRDRDLPERPAIDFVRGIRTADGIDESVIQPVAQFAQQLLADGPLADKFDAVGRSYDAEAALVLDLPAMPNGSVARVFGEPDIEDRGIYQMIAGVWTRIGPLPEADTAALEEQVGAVEIRATDLENREPSMEVDILTVAGLPVPHLVGVDGMAIPLDGGVRRTGEGAISTGNFEIELREIEPGGRPALLYIAPDGFAAVMAVSPPDPMDATGGGSGSSSFEAQDAAGQAYSASVPFRELPIFAGLWWDWVIFMDYGQSLAQGGASHPPKTLSVPDFNVSIKMAGTSVRPLRENNTWYAFGTTAAPSVGGTIAFNDLVATMDIDNTGSGNKYDPATFVLSPTGGTNGEIAGVAAAYELLKRINESRNELTGNALNRNFLVNANGFGGQTSEALTSDADMPTRAFSAKLRCESFYTQLSAHFVSTYPGKTFGIAAWEWDQGQADALSNFTKQRALDGLTAARNMVNQRFCDAILQQSPPASIAPPAMIIVQTGGHWVAGKPNVPQAQHEFALSTPAVWMSTPTFAVPGKMEIPIDGVSLPSTEDMTSATLNEHLDGNGMRIIGAYRAKLLHRLLWERRNWEHMHIFDGTWRVGTPDACVTWHCPSGKRQVLECFQGYRRVTYSDWGLELKQGGIPLAVASKAEFGRQSIKFQFAEVPTPGVPLTIEVGVRRGRHNIADSDPAVSRFVYEHSHQDYAAADPYPANMTAQEIAINNEVIAELGG
jgi:hypothetical protein